MLLIPIYPCSWDEIYVQYCIESTRSIFEIVFRDHVENVKNFGLCEFDESIVSVVELFQALI